MNKTIVWSVIGGCLVIFGIVGAVYTALSILCWEVDSVQRFQTATATAKHLTAQVTTELEELEVETKASFRDIQLSRLRQDLRRLAKRYGTTNCDVIGRRSTVDADECRWLKDEITRLTTK